MENRTLFPWKHAVSYGDNFILLVIGLINSFVRCSYGVNYHWKLLKLREICGITQRELILQWNMKIQKTVVIKIISNYVSCAIRGLGLGLYLTQSHMIFMPSCDWVNLSSIGVAAGKTEEVRISYDNLGEFFT